MHWGTHHLVIYLNLLMAINQIQAIVSVSKKAWLTRRPYFFFNWFKPLLLCNSKGSWYPVLVEMPPGQLSPPMPEQPEQ